jgi:hypothetical protein
MQFTTSVTHKGQATFKPGKDFFSLKGSVKSNKPFDLNAMEKAIEDEIIKKYVKNGSS